jgi:hypothetical protein
LPTVTGFIDTFVMATAFLIVCMLSALLVPAARSAAPSVKLEGKLAPASESS